MNRAGVLGQASAGRGGAASGPGAPLQRSLRSGAAASAALWLFMGVAAMLFALFIVAYVMRMNANDASAIAMPWQLWLSTAWLVAGSLLLQRAAALGHAGIPMAQLRWPLLAAGACALAFVVVQWWAWQALLGRQVALQGNPAGSFFYMLTAMHALHVVGGLVGWLMTLGALRGATTVGDASWRIALCARYWHFLLAAWLVLFGAFSLITPELASLLCGGR